MDVGPVPRSCGLCPGGQENCEQSCSKVKPEGVYNPPEDEFIKSAADKFNVCSLNMQIIADYSDLESFLKELYKYPYLININKIELTPYPKNKKILMSILQLKLYSSK